MPLGPCKHPPLPNKPGSNWVEKTGGLPHFIDCVARAIFHTGRSGGDVSKAVQIAIGQSENWAEGKGNVSASTRAQAAAAVAQLKAQGAASKAQTRAKNLSDCGCLNIDLSTFDETKHKRLPRGTGGGRFASVASAVSKLKQGETHTVHGPSGTKVKRITATRFLVESGGKSRTTDNPHAAAKQAVEMAQAAVPVRRKNRRAMTLSSDLERRVVDLTERLTA